MRRSLLAVSAAILVATAGCAPESMATHAVPAQHAPPSALTPSISPSPSVTPTEAAAAAQAEPVEVQLNVDDEESSPTPSPSPSAAAPTVLATAETEPVPTVTPTQAPVTPSAQPTPAKPRPAATVTPTAPTAGSQWRDVNLDNLTYSDAGRLTTVSPSFRDYAVQAMSAADTDGCTVLGLSVLSVHPDGFVVGSVSTDCGGGQAIWAANGDEQWKVAMVLQAAPLCTELSSIGLPAGVGLLCDDGAANLSEY